jgi:hypothetical protein
VQYYSRDPEKYVHSTPWKAFHADQTVEEVELWDGGLTFHHLALLVAGACALFACGISIFLIMQHATHYSKPIEQRQLV